MIQYNISAFEFLNLAELQKVPPAHRALGISLKSFSSSLTTSFIIATTQILLFSYLRPRLLHVYQPRSYFAPEKSRVESLSQCFFGWIKPCWDHNISEFIESSGLDAYCFIRLLKMLFVMSLGLSFINVPILIPTNYFGSSGTANVSGLDKLSWSNISPEKSARFNAHFVLALVSLIFVHGIIFYELRLFIKIRHSFLLKSEQAKSVLMIDNIPGEYKLLHSSGANLAADPLLNSLNKLPGGIKNIWFIYSFSEIKALYEKNKRLLRDIEYYETKILLKNWKLYRNQELLTKVVVANSSNRETPIAIELADLNETNSAIQQMLIDDKLQAQENKSRPKKLLPLTLLGRFKIKVPCCCLKVDLVSNIILKYQENNAELIKTREKVLKEKVPCYHKMFVQFNKQISSYIVKQSLLSSNPGQNNFKVIEINPKDIVWNNIKLNNFWMKKIRYFVSNILKVFLVVFWIIPTVFIGLFSQSPYFTKVFPFIGWIDNSPNLIKSFIAGVFPALSLILITELIPILFRWLSILKGRITGAEVEKDIQNWCFGFFFVHVFLIVTISSSVTAIIDSLINNPVSIPTLLATNLPKASNFFFSFILLRGFSYSGNNLLRAYVLFKKYIVYPCFRKMTPREKFFSITKLEPVKWGSIYPIYSILGCICIIFSIIAPLVTVFSTISFGLVLMSFKYSLRFCYSSDNDSETYGKFYPIALSQLYCGIYCLEISLIGLFFLVRNQNDESTCVRHGTSMILIFLISLSTQLYTNNAYKGALNYLPLEYLEYEDEERPEDFDNNEDCDGPKATLNCFNENNYDITFSHPSFEYNVLNDFIWLPRDKYGIHLKETSYLKSKGLRATSDNAIINDKGEVLIRGLPKIKD